MNEHHTCTYHEWLKHGPRLVAEGVTSVKFTDIEPCEIDNSGRYYWPKRIAYEFNYYDGFDRSHEECVGIMSKAAIKWAMSPKRTTNGDRQ